MSVNPVNFTYTLPNGTVYGYDGSGANCTIAVCPIDLSVYGYRPSPSLSSILIGLYSLCMVAQICLAWKYKTWGFLSAMVLGCIDEIIGYAGRILMYKNPWNHNGFIIQIGELANAPFRRTATWPVNLCSLPTKNTGELPRQTPKDRFWRPWHDLLNN